MNPMQRRHFLKTALIGAGAAGSLVIPAVHAARASDPASNLHASLLRAEPHGDGLRWQALDQCSSAACAGATRTRVSIDRLQFPAGFGSVAVDAMFATSHGLRPFRMASYQPDSLSPVSKPFAFDVDATGLAGFRAEHTGSVDAALAIASSPLLGAARPSLADGRYLLVLSRAEVTADLTATAVSTQADDAIASTDGTELPFACIAFSVQRLA